MIVEYKSCCLFYSYTNISLSLSLYLSIFRFANTNTAWGSEELLNMACEIEGHPDNVAPAVYVLIFSYATAISLCHGYLSMPMCHDVMMS